MSGNGIFVNPLARRASGVAGTARTIKDWTRHALCLGDEAVVSVNELSCHVLGCPPKETVILVMHRGDTTQISIHKAMPDVTKVDVETAFSARERDSTPY